MNKTTEKPDVYCVYTDKTIVHAKANSEHIMPLSLGGANGFEIGVSAAFNSEVGSRIDGAMANDFFVAMRRTKHDARGHSGRKPWATVKHAEIDGRPAQVHLSVRDGLRVWDARDRRELDKAETAGKPITLTPRLNLDDLAWRFVAKVALGAGYFVYGDQFREQVAHGELRTAMNAKKHTDLKESDLPSLRFDYFLSPPPPADSPLETLRGICDNFNGSIVLLTTTAGSLRITVGVLGKYVGTLNVAASTATFPNTAAYKWGHVILLHKRVMQRRPASALLEKLT